MSRMGGFVGYFDYFFSPDRPAALIVNSIIVSIGLFSLYQLFAKGFLPLRREQAGISQLRLRLRRNSESSLLGRESVDNTLRETFSRDREALLVKSPLLAARIAQLESLR